MHHLPKFRDLAKPTYFDNVNRRWDSRLKKRGWTYHTSDPLFFDHKLKYINGGIQVYIDHCHDAKRYNIPLNRMAYILYNMVQDDIYDPSVFDNFEKNYRTKEKKELNGRMAFGALWAYYKSNQGSLFGVDFWTSILQDYSKEMRVQEVSRLLEAFRDNRQLHRSHMTELLDKNFKNDVILQHWEQEVRHNQRTLFDLAKELDGIMWYDEEVWMKIFYTAASKKKINNLHDFQLIHNLMVKLSSKSQGNQYTGHLHGKFETQIN